MRRSINIFAAVLSLLLILCTSPASAQDPYEVWFCDGFNAQGYQSSDYVQFYPFNAKIGDLYKIDISRSEVLAINRGASGDFYGYWLTRTDGAPIYWLRFNANFEYLNGTELFSTCGYSAQ